MRLADWQRRFEAARPEERVDLLLEFGFSPNDIARVLPRPNGQPEPVPFEQAWLPDAAITDRLAELCALLSYFVSNATYDEAGILAWLQTANPDLRDRCPLDVLRDGSFQGVRGAWDLAVEIVAVDESELWSPPKGRRRRRRLRWPRRHVEVRGLTEQP